MSSHCSFKVLVFTMPEVPTVTIFYGGEVTFDHLRISFEDKFSLHDECSFLIYV